MLLVAAAAALPGRLAGQQLPAATSPPRFEIRALPDAAILGTGLFMSSVPLLLRSAVSSPCPCATTGLWGPDAGAVGSLDTAVSRVSDVTLVASVGLAAFSLARSRPGEGWEPRGEDLAVLVQSLSVAAGLTEVLKAVTRRPRPYVYENQPAGTVERTDVSSFPSGHSATSFAAAAAYWSVMRRRGLARRHTPEIVTLFGLATATAALRVVAHKHFPSDAVAGAVLGATVGWVIPRMHAVR